MHNYGLENISLSFWAEGCLGIIKLEKNILPYSQKQLTRLQHWGWKLKFQLILLCCSSMTPWMLPSEDRSLSQGRFHSTQYCQNLTMSSNKFYVLLLILYQLNFCIFLLRDFNIDDYYRNFQQLHQNI